MRVRDYLDINRRQQRSLSRSMQVLLVAIAVFGLYTSRTTVVVNAGIGLIITFMPAFLERDYGIVMDAGLVLWITTAVFLHAAGSLGPYGYIWWWDHLTHTLSSSVVAAAGYASFRAVEQHSTRLHFPGKLLFLFILIFVMAFGVTWELMEFGLALATSLVGTTPFLTQYGLADTMTDLVFDLLGGVVVALFGEVYLTGITGEIASYLELRDIVNG